MRPFSRFAKSRFGQSRFGEQGLIDVEEAVPGVLDANSGHYILTGTAASFIYHRVMESSTGAFNLSGSTAGLLFSRRLSAEGGSLSLAGQDVSFGEAAAPVNSTVPVITSNGKIGSAQTFDAATWEDGAGDPITPDAVETSWWTTPGDENVSPDENYTPLEAHDGQGVIVGQRAQKDGAWSEWWWSAEQAITYNAPVAANALPDRNGLTVGTAMTPVDVAGDFSVTGDADLSGATITLTSGTLPPGITFDGSTLSGTPTDTQAQTNLVFTAANSGGSVQSGMSITVSAAAAEGFQGSFTTSTTPQDGPSSESMTLSTSLDWSQDMRGEVLTRLPASGSFSVNTISPAGSTDPDDGRHIHGTQWQFDGVTNQGFDAFYASSSSDTRVIYSDAKNIDPGRTGSSITINVDDWTYTVSGSTNPLPGTPTTGFSLLKGKSRDAPTDRNVLVDMIPFRFIPHSAVIPADFTCAGTRDDQTKVSRAVEDFDLNTLPSWAEYTDASMQPFKRTTHWGFAHNGKRALDLDGERWFGWGGDAIGQAKSYWRMLASSAATDAQKRRALRELYAWGAEIIGASRDGQPIGADGAQHSNVRYVVALAAHVSQDPDWVAEAAEEKWHEDEQVLIIGAEHIGWKITDDGRDADEHPRFDADFVGFPWYSPQISAQDLISQRLYVNTWSALERRSYGAYNYARPLGIILIAHAIARAQIPHGRILAMADRAFPVMKDITNGVLSAGGGSDWLSGSWNSSKADLVDIQAWEAHRAEIADAVWTGPPDPVQPPSAHDNTTANLVLQLGAYQYDNGSPITRKDILAIPKFGDEDHSVLWDRVRTQAVEFNDVTPDGNDRVTVNGLAGGQVYQFLARFHNANGTSPVLTRIHSTSSAVMGQITPNIAMEATPRNWIVPTLSASSGALQPGVTLTINGGTWTENPAATPTYRWERSNDDFATSSTISGETGSTYQLDAADVGYKVRGFEIRTNSQGSTEEATVATVEIQASAAETLTLLTTVENGNTLTLPGSEADNALVGVWAARENAGYFYPDSGDNPNHNYMDLTSGTNSINGGTQAWTGGSGSARNRAWRNDMGAGETSVNFLSSLSGLASAGAIYRHGAGRPMRVKEMVDCSHGVEKTVTTVANGAVVIAATNTSSATPSISSSDNFDTDVANASGTTRGAVFSHKGTLAGSVSFTVNSGPDNAHITAFVLEPAPGWNQGDIAPVEVSSQTAIGIMKPKPDAVLVAATSAIGIMKPSA